MPRTPLMKMVQQAFKIEMHSSKKNNPASDELIEEVHDHCSLKFQGYMNGAAESERKISEKIMDLL